MGIWKERNCWLDWMLLPMAYELWKMFGLTSSNENELGSPADVDQLMLAGALLCQSVGVSKTNAAAKGARATRALIRAEKSAKSYARRDDGSETHLTAANILDESRKSTFGEVEDDGARARRERSKGNVANVARGTGRWLPTVLCTGVRRRFATGRTFQLASAAERIRQFARLLPAELPRSHALVPAPGRGERPPPRPARSRLRRQVLLRVHALSLP